MAHVTWQLPDGSEIKAMIFGDEQVAETAAEGVAEEAGEEAGEETAAAQDTVAPAEGPCVDEA